MSNLSHEAFKKFFVVVIAANISEFKAYADKKIRTVGEDNFFAYGPRFRVYSVEEPALRTTLFKVYKYSYDFIYWPPNKTLNSLDIPSLNSWEVIGTGDRRADFPHVVDECRARWCDENPTDIQFGTYENYNKPSYLKSGRAFC